MRRIFAALSGLIVLFAGTTIAAGGAAAGTSAASSVTVTTDATAYQINPAHDGQQIDPAFAGANQVALWSKDLGGPVQYPLIVGNTVFVDVGHTNPDGSYTSGTSVSAYDRSDGSLRWGPVNIGGTYGFGAIAYDNGSVFALNYNGQLFALDAATGAEKWSVQLGTSNYTSPPTALNGTVYVGGNGSLLAVSETTGTVNWSGSVFYGDSSSPAVDASGVYVSYACEQTYSFALTGALRWHHVTDCSGGGGRTPVLHSGAVYVRDDAGKPPVALSESDGSPLSGFTAQPAPAFGDNVMVTLSSHNLTATDPTTGTVQWTRADASYVTAPLIVNGFVVEGDSSGIVHLLDATTGNQVWQATAGSPISAPDEHNANGLTGLAEGQGILAVPAGHLLTIFGSPTVAITSGPAQGSTIRGSVVFTFSALPSGTPLSCTLDDAPATPCTSPYTVAGLSDGPHRLTVTNNSNPSAQVAASVNFLVDVTAPKVSVIAETPFSSRWSVTPSWTATDLRSGTASYDVRYRVAAANGAFGGYVLPASLQATRATSFVATPGQGRTVCTSVRARDRLGNLSAWSPDTCQAVVLDDRAFAAAGAWYRPSGLRGFSAGTFSATSARGASLSFTSTATRRVEVIGTTCPACGRVSVSMPGMAPFVVNFHSTSVARRTFVLPAFAAAHSGRLTLTALDAGRPVYIDAIGVLHG